MNEMIKKATLEIDHDGKGKFPHHPPELVDKPPAGADKPQNGISAYHPALAHDLTAQMARSAEGLVKAEVGKQTEKGATDLSAVAAALRQSSKGLEHNVVSPYVEKAADQIDRVSHFLRTAEPKDMLAAVESYAKREPLLFLGGAFAAGLLGARFIKSSSQSSQAAGASAKHANQMRAVLPASKGATQAGPGSR